MVSETTALPSEPQPLPWSEGELIDLKASSFSSYRIGGDDDDSDESSEEEDIFGISYLGSIPAPALEFK